MASGIPKGVAAVPHKQLSDCRTSKCVRLKKGTRYYRATGESPVNFDTLRGESMHYCGISCHIRSSLTAEASRSGYSSSTVPANCLRSRRGPAASSRRGPWRAPERERGRVRMAQAGQKVCGDGTVAGVRRRARRTRAAEGRSVPAQEPRERVQKELAVTRCRAVVVLWRLCTVGKVRLQQRSTMVVPRCSLA